MAAGQGQSGRRQFLRRAGLAGLGVVALPLLAACRGRQEATPVPEPLPVEPIEVTPTPSALPVQFTGVKLAALVGSSLVPAADRTLRQLVREWAETHQAEVAVETIGVAALQARLASQAKGGPDIVQCRDAAVQQFAEHFAELTPEAEGLAARYGGYAAAASAQARVNGTWRALPFTIAPSAVIYRADWFQQAGAATFPPTFEELLTVGQQLKKAGRPFGAPAGRSSEDPRTLWNAVLWGFGGQEVEADGRTIAIDRPETVAALEWAVRFWSAACSEDGLNWDDNANNRLYASGDLAATPNGPAIYLQVRREFPELAAKSNHAPLPQGRAGGGAPVTTYAHAVLQRSPNGEAARALLSWLSAPDQLDRYLTAAGGTLVGPLAANDASPIWSAAPQFQGCRDAAKIGRWVGWPAPPSRATANSDANFIIVDLFARVLSGKSPKASIAEAVTALRGAYQT